MAKNKKNTIIRGIGWGMIAGVVDVLPMLAQRLPWSADVSAFLQWVVVGFFIATIQIPLRGIMKGIVIALAALLPIAVLIGAAEPMTLIPVVSMTVILGGALGYILEK